MASHDEYPSDNLQLGLVSEDGCCESNFQAGYNGYTSSNTALQYGSLRFYRVLPPESEDEVFVSCFLFNDDTTRSKPFVPKLYTLYTATVSGLKEESKPSTSSGCSSMSTAEPMECDHVLVSPTTLSSQDKPAVFRVYRTTDQLFYYSNSQPLPLQDPEPANPSSHNSETSSVELDRSADDGTSTAFQLQRSAGEPTADDGSSTAFPSPPLIYDPHQSQYMAPYNPHSQFIPPPQQSPLPPPQQPPPPLPQQSTMMTLTIISQQANMQNQMLDQQWVPAGTNTAAAPINNRNISAGTNTAQDTPISIDNQPSSSAVSSCGKKGGARPGLLGGRRCTSHEEKEHVWIIYTKAICTSKATEEHDQGQTTKEESKPVRAISTISVKGSSGGGGARCQSKGEDTTPRAIRLFV